MRASNKTVHVVGLMSGTSADGIDAVVAEFQPGSVQLSGPCALVRAHVHVPFTHSFRTRIQKASRSGTVAEICELNFALGDRFAAAALRAIESAGLETEDIVAIGSHGQTVHHIPRKGRISTLQIGEPAVIAERTGITTIADFRVGDVAAGGQGAPLVPLADWALFKSPERPRIIQNIGGIANLTFLPRAAALDHVLAFDTGPGNMVIDGLASALTNGKSGYDKDGEWAARGRVSDELLRILLRHPFLKKHPPKTTGREEFGDDFVSDVLGLGTKMRVKPADLIATATEFTAASIALAVNRYVLPCLGKADRARLQMILGGGGTNNLTLVAALRGHLSPVELMTHEAFGVRNEAKEALAFALLAWQTLRGLPGNVPSATGAKRAVVLGKIVCGREAEGFWLAPGFNQVGLGRKNIW